MAFFLFFQHSEV